MKRLLIATIILLLWASPAMAQTNYGLSFDYRVDNLQWNIAGNVYGTYPNILSELTWTDLNIYQLDGFVKTDLEDGCFFYGNLKFGIITSGQNQDSDYNKNNRTNEYSRSNNDANGDNTLDLSGAFGFNLIQTPTLTISPMIGYSYNQQNLVITNGYQTIPATGSFSGLHSTYKTEWFGLWVGINLEKALGSKFKLYNAVEYHWVDYEATANWNLRDDLQHPVSFKHTADGTGYTLSTGIDYLYKDYTTIRFKISYLDWKTDFGIDTTYFVNGSIDQTQLNEVKWDSTTFSIAIIKNF